MFSKYKSLYLILLLLFSAASSADCQKEPIEQTKYLFEKGYYFYAWSIPEFMDILAPKFSNALQKEFQCKTEGELCAIDVDPWISAQDGEASPPYKFTQAKLNEKVAVEFSYQFTLGTTAPKPQIVKILFSKRKDGCWLIEDFISPGGYSMLNDLTEWHAKYNSDN